MTASQLLLVQTIRGKGREEQPAGTTLDPASVLISATLLDVAKGKILNSLFWLDPRNVSHPRANLGCDETLFPCIVRLASHSI